jgi:hypothetical protein
MNRVELAAMKQTTGDHAPIRPLRFADPVIVSCSEFAALRELAAATAKLYQNYAERVASFVVWPTLMDIDATEVSAGDLSVTELVSRHAPADW